MGTDRSLQHGIFLYPTGEVYAGQWAASGAVVRPVQGPKEPQKPPLGRRRRRQGLCWPCGASRSRSPSSGSCGSAPGSDRERPNGGDERGVCLRRPSAPAVVKGAAPCREGWGVHLHGPEKYQGEWHRDLRHGLGCFNARAGERYAGQFVEGERSGHGVGISRDGVVNAEEWQAGQLVFRRPLFGSRGRARRRRSAELFEESPEEGEEVPARCESPASPPSSSSSSSSSPRHVASASARTPCSGGQCRGWSDREDCPDRREPPPVVDSSEAMAAVGAEALEAEGCIEGEQRSSLLAMPSWTPREVARLARHLGLSADIAARLRSNLVDGSALRTLASRSAASALSAVFREAPEVEDRGCAADSQPCASRRLLVATVELILKCRHKLLVPQPSAEMLRERFAGMEIQEGQMEFGDCVGEGGYGLVYRARWHQTEVAVKALRAGKEGKIPRDFYSELCILQQLRHPNVTLLVGFTLRPQCAIVTEFVADGTLFELLHRRSERVTRCFSWLFGVAREICSGVVYLHVNGIVHCDLKSANVLLNGTWQAKLCDFGFAQVLPDGHEETGVNIGCVGTHHWMAPEVLRGEEYSKASDVYSLGIIVWEIATLRTPFRGFTAQQVVGLVGYGRRRPRLPKGCPMPLRAVVAGMLRAQPRSRRTAHDVGAELDALHRATTTDVEDRLRAFLAG